LTVKDTLPIVVKASGFSNETRPASGDSFDVAIISSKGYKELTEEEKKSITEAKARAAVLTFLIQRTNS